MKFWNEFSGPNAGYVLELYEKYLQDPASIDEKTRAIFMRWSPPMTGSARENIDETDISKVVGGVNYADAIRDYGLFAAQLDPLGSNPTGDPSLNVTAHGITEDDLKHLPAHLIGGPIAHTSTSAWDAIQKLKEVYCSTIGYDFEHVRVPEERQWLRQAAESRRFYPESDPIHREALLERLTEVEGFEQFLHRMFPGKHRFSLEGLDMMVPIFDEMIGASAEHGIYNISIGMAHRGRLNMLAHTLKKPYAQILAEFKDPVQDNKYKYRDEIGWTGDVKYHLGARHAIQNGAPIDVVINMAPNPSHLEFVNPVVLGMSRAAGTRVDKGGVPVFDPNATLPILIHGDAAFPGQGIVAETLNLSRLPGYWTGGSIHIIANNQLGYTTEPIDSRSTLFASDLAKGFKIPIIHVNADDPEACIMAARMAFAYMMQFRKDVVIDLIGYRRYGHNEGDEPAFTQPMMYQRIEKHPTVRRIWGEKLVSRGIIGSAIPDQMVRSFSEKMQRVYESLDLERDLIEARPTAPEPGTAKRTKTGLSLKRLSDLQSALLTFPEDFNIHSKLQRLIKRRLEVLKDPNSQGVDWASAEELAMASILADGIGVRITGQDVGRGTFSQRHAVLHDSVNGKKFIPLQSLPYAKAAYEIHNSPLTEAAVLGFEYGYNVQEPHRLVIWEAQYGDFNNGGQVIIDEFIVSARAKWGQTPSLVMLLPHGYEGAGPDHSSARLERFLNMAAETNMRIANATTAAQYFHLLRRQAMLLESDPLPLIVMTPKSLLRNANVSSSLNELANGKWNPVLDDVVTTEKPEAVQRVVLCSGKVYYDLTQSSFRQEHPEIAIVRVEQLYPFPVEDIKAIFKKYANMQEVLWVQEEPENMGAWEFARPLLEEIADKHFPLYYVGRARNSSPSEGSLSAHTMHQTMIIEQTFSPIAREERDGIVVN